VAILSGPVPGLFQGAPTGVRAYFALVNAHGGVYGRQLAVDGYDDGFNGQQNALATQQAVTKDFALVGNFSLFDNYGCKVLAAASSVPDVSVTLDPGTNSLPNDFSAQPVGEGQQLGPLLFYKRHYPTAVRKAAALVANVSTATAQWHAQELAMEHVGYHFTYVADVSPLTTDFTTDVITMRSEGVQAVDITNLDYQLDATFMQDLAQQNWHPQLVFSAGPAYTNQFIKAAGGPASANGLWIGQGDSLYLGQDRASIPAVGTFLSWVHRVAPAWNPDLFTLYGWASAQLFVQALRAAGPHPTRGAVLTALHHITSFDASRLLADGDPANKEPPSCYIMARVINGGFQRVADPPDGGYRCDAPYYEVPGLAG
jgi:ABC-type branched-subunit amino acid transport system substrate-binding protein